MLPVGARAARGARASVGRRRVERATHLCRVIAGSIMFVLRLILGAAAVVMLHAALFTQPPAGARERARRRR